jgi:hypothetical protein
MKQGDGIFWFSAHGNVCKWILFPNRVGIVEERGGVRMDEWRLHRMYCMYILVRMYVIG